MKYDEIHQAFFEKLNFILKDCNRSSLYLALCDDDSFVEKTHNIILNKYDKSVQWLNFPSDNLLLYSFLENNINCSKVNIVNGLKDNLEIDKVLIIMNYLRESFYKFNIPIILWVDESIMGKFIKLAPHFYNCTSSICLMPHRYC